MGAEVNGWLRLGTCAVLLLLAQAAAAFAAQTSQASAATALVRALDADELELSALVARLGDDAILDALAQERDSALRLAAVRACPYLDSPELALEPLVNLAAGRDPDLAPAAARRVRAIAQALALEDGAARELSARAFHGVEQQLTQLAAAAALRPDIRLCVGEAALLLRVGSHSGS
jgi:hypothetical protein